jgi:glycosyltransferase involved in cell wall biosynthesis
MPSSSASRRLLLTLYPPDGGVTRHVIDLVGGLDPDRWRIDIACPPGSDPWLQLADRPGVRLHPLSPGKEPGLSDASDLRRILRLVAEADVVHAHASKAGFLTRLAAALRRRRGATVFTPHSWSFWAHEWRSSLWLALERRAAHWCGAIVSVSDAERRAGVAAGVGSERQYHVILNGIDPAPFAGARRTVPGRILLVGRLAAQKRPDIAIRALARVRERYPGAQLDLVAHGPLEAGSRALVAELGLQDGVRFLGKRDDVPELLAKAECFLLTSDYEGCPYTVLEAMAASVPVVATRVGGVPELVADGETGMLFEPGDPEAAAAALQRVLGEREWARGLGEAGRERVLREFDRERMVRDTSALYDSLS